MFCDTDILLSAGDLELERTKGDLEGIVSTGGAAGLLLSVFSLGVFEALTLSLIAESMSEAGSGSKVMVPSASWKLSSALCFTFGSICLPANATRVVSLFDLGLNFPL